MVGKIISLSVLSISCLYSSTRKTRKRFCPFSSISERNSCGMDTGDLSGLSSGHNGEAGYSAITSI